MGAGSDPRASDEKPKTRRDRRRDPGPYGSIVAFVACRFVADDRDSHDQLRAKAHGLRGLAPRGGPKKFTMKQVLSLS
jgi:hypothetical protein